MHLDGVTFYPLISIDPSQKVGFWEASYQ